MSRTFGVVIFLAVAIAIVSVAHYYLWLRLIRDPDWPPPFKQLGTIVVLVLAVALPVGSIMSRMFDGALRPVAWAVYVWMGLLLLLTTFLAAGDLIRLGLDGLQRIAAAASLAPPAVAADPDRRLFLARLWAGAALLTASGAGVHGMRIALTPPEVKRVPITLERLPAALGGLRIVQLSDLHIGPTLGSAWLEEVVARVNELAPDLVAITGDLVDGSVPELRTAVAPIAGLRSRWGVYFVTGNHEYYSGVEGWMRELERLGVRVLRNERVTVGGPPEASFELAGIDDASAHRFGRGHGADLPRALAGYDPSRELVLLAHQPKAIDEAAALGVGLQLSGHTHGGQIWPWSYAVRLVQPYVAGLARHGGTQIYVSRGTGFWGPPMRVGAPPEITLLELSSSQPAVTAKT